MKTLYKTVDLILITPFLFGAMLFVSSLVLLVSLITALTSD